MKVEIQGPIRGGAYDYRVGTDQGQVFYASNSTGYNERTTYLYDQEHKEILGLFIKELEDGLTFYILEDGRVSLSFEKMPYYASRKYYAPDHQWLIAPNFLSTNFQIFIAGGEKHIASLSLKGLGYLGKATLNLEEDSHLLSCIGISLFLIKSKIGDV